MEEGRGEGGFWFLVEVFGRWGEGERDRVGEVGRIGFVFLCSLD